VERSDQGAGVIGRVEPDVPLLGLTAKLPAFVVLAFVAFVVFVVLLLGAALVDLDFVDLDGVLFTPSYTRKE